MLLSTLKNPFGNFQLDNTTNLPPGDVPELHARILEQCSAAIETARNAGQSTSLLVIGEAGSGKSHMIAQCRKKMALDPRAVLVSIRLGGANAGCLWRHLRERFVTELLEKYNNTENGESGLLRILRNRFPKWASAEGSASSILDILIGKPNASNQMRLHLEEFAKSCPSFGIKLRKVLPQLLKADLTTLAQDWLRGEQLTEEDLRKLNLPPEFPSDLEQENIARSVVLSFLHLAGDKTNIFLFFDEVEAIQAGKDDTQVLRQFATISTQLLAEAGTRVIATSIRPTLQISLFKAVEVSNQQKMSQFVSRIPSLNWEQTVRIVSARLDAEPTCRAARQQHNQDPFWPLDQKFLETTFSENRLNLTPRHLIVACRVEFERIQKGKPSERFDSSDSESTKEKETRTKPRADELTRTWETQRKKYLEKPQSIQFDNVMAIGLPWLIKLADISLVQVLDRDKRLGDINLLFQPSTNAKKAVGISFCNHEPRQLHHRLKRIKSQWQTTKDILLANLVILRCESTRTTQTAKGLFDDLQNAGIRMVHLHSQQLAELAAFQLLLTASLEGDVMRHGRPIEPADYSSWAAANLSAAVKEFLHQVFEIEAKTAVEPQPVVAKKKRAAVAQK
jgi:hypothetical protein